MTEDTILLDRYIADGDRAALEELFARHYGAVHRTILHMVHNSFDADDLAQATFLRAVKKSDQFDSSGSFRGWLLAIAVNQVRDFRRGTKRKREDQLFDMFAATGKDSDVPATGMRREFEQKLEQALETLSPELKDPLVLHYYEGMSFAEVGATLGLPKSTVQTRVRSSIGVLRQEFTKRGWVALLPTFDHALSQPTTAAAGTTTALTTRRVAAWVCAAAVVISSIIGIAWWQSPALPQPSTVPTTIESANSERPAAADVNNTPATNTRNAAPTAPTVPMVHGRIVDAATGEAIREARVRLHDYVSGVDRFNTTGPNGWFAFPITVGRTDAFALVVTKSGRGRVLLDSVVASEQPREIRLVPEATVRCKVLDHDGKPITSCRVSAFRTPNDAPLALLMGALPHRLRIDAWTEDEEAPGTYILRGLSAVPVMLVVQFRNEQPWLVARGETVVPGQCGEQVVQLPRAKSYRVHVRDKLTGKPLPKAQIHERIVNGSWSDAIRAPFAATNEPGVYTLRRWISRRARVGQADGSYKIVRRPNMDTLLVTAPGYAPCQDTREQMSEDDDYVFEMERGAQISGETVDADGKPISGSRVIVIVEDEARSLVLSDENGHFVADSLPSDYEVQVQSYRPDHTARLSVAAFELEPGQQRSVTLGGIANGALIGSLKLRGEPVAGAVVQIEHDKRHRLQSLTDAAGQFRIDSQPLGACTLTMWADVAVTGGKTRHIRVQRELQVQPGRNIRIDIDLRHEVRGVCIDAATNEPAERVSVQAVPIGNPDSPIASESSKADGSFHMFVEDVGGYELRAKPSTKWFSLRNQTFNATGTASTHDLRLEVHKDPQTASLEVHVVNSDGKPITTSVFKVTGVSVQADGKALNGKLTFDGLRGGHYEVRLHDNQHVDQQFAFDVTPGQKSGPHKIVMPPATALAFIAPDAAPDKPPHPSGMIDGDRILSWNSHKITHLADLVTVMEALDGATAPLVVLRDGEQLELQASKRLIPESIFDFRWPYNFGIALQNRE